MSAHVSYEPQLFFNPHQHLPTHPPTTGNTRTIQAAIQAAKDAQLDAAEFAKAATKKRELVGLIASKGS